MMFVFKLLGWIVGLVVAAIIALLLFLRFGTPVYDWHQEMTVVIDTPDGPVSGSSVSAVRWKEHAIKAQGMGWSLKVTGEAVVVDLGPSASRPRYLFALMKGAGTTEYMGSVAAASLSGREGRVIDEALFAQIKNRQGAAAKPIAVPPIQYPLMVTFAEIDDPASVARVDPDDLDASFGCERSQADGDFPWRGQGKTWRQWQEVEALEQARQAAAHEAGLPAGLSAAMVEADKMMGTNTVRKEEEQARLLALHSQYTGKQFDAWRKAKWKLQRQFTLASRDTSHDCHRLSSITLAITDELVTQGRVEAVLGWLPAAEFIIPPHRQANYVKDQSIEERIMPSDFVDWRTLRDKREGSR